MTFAPSPFPGGPQSRGDEVPADRLTEPLSRRQLVGSRELGSRHGSFEPLDVDGRSVAQHQHQTNRLRGVNRPSDQALRRSIGIVFSDGGLLALSAVRPVGASGHGDEQVATVLCDPDRAPVEVSETLLSTEYGPDGVQRRATLELWIDGEEAQPLRGAGTLISAAKLRRPGINSDIAFFRWAVEGREGLGHYELIRGDG